MLKAPLKGAFFWLYAVLFWTNFTLDVYTYAFGSVCPIWGIFLISINQIPHDKRWCTFLLFFIFLIKFWCAIHNRPECFGEICGRSKSDFLRYFCYGFGCFCEKFLRFLYPYKVKILYKWCVGCLFEYSAEMGFVHVKSFAHIFEGYIFVEIIFYIF